MFARFAERTMQTGGRDLRLDRPMLVHLRRLSAQTLIFGLGGAVTQVAAMLLLPIYTRILTPDDYGQIAIVTLVTSVIAILLNGGQNTAFFFFYFQRETPDARRQLTGTVVIYLLVSAAVFLLLLIVFGEPAAALLFKDVTLWPLLQVALVGTFFDAGNQIPFATFRAEQRAAQYAALSILRFVINVTLNIIAVAVLRWGVVGVIYANLLTSVLFFGACLGLRWHAIAWTVDFSLLRPLLRFGLPLVPGALASWALNLSNRFFLERYADLHQIGIYAVGYSIAGVVNMLMGWFNTAYAPYVFSIAGQPGAKTVYARMMTYALTLFTLVGLGLSIFASQALLLLATPSYYGAASVVPLIALAHLFYELDYILSFGLNLANKTAYYSFIMGAGAVVNLMLNFILIPPFGIMGAAVSSALSYGLLPIIDYLIVRRVYPVSYEWTRLLKLALVSTGAYLISIVFRTSQFWVDLAVGAALILTWCLVLYWWRFFTPNELSATRAAMNKGVCIFQVRLRRVVSTSLRGIESE